MNNQAAQTMPERPEFSVDEALRIADQNADAYDKVASVSRTLAAEVRRLAALSQTAGVAGGWVRDVADAAAALDKPGAEALRELVQRWRISASVCGESEYSDGARDAFSQCADELESLLARGAE